MNSIKVILVDDEQEFVTTLSERIQIRNIGTHIAFSGEQALEMVKNFSFDAMVLDLNMPGMDGLAVLKSVKKIHPEIQVIILTGHGSEADQKLTLSSGAFAYLQKPVELDTLIHHIKNAYFKKTPHYTGIINE